MIISLIIILIVMSLTAGGVYVAYSASSTLATQHHMTQTESSAKIAKEFIIKNSIAQNGNFLVPLGNALETYHQLPGAIGSAIVNHNGVAFAYCPLGGSNDLSNSADIAQANGATFQAGTTTIGDMDFVQGSEIESGDWVAAIITTLPNANALPSCSDITFTENNVRAQGGQVWGISKNDILTDKVISASSERAFLVSPDGEEENSLETILTAFQQGVYGNGTIRISLEDGTYEIAESALDFSSTSGAKHLVLEGQSGAVINSDGGSTMTALLADNSLTLKNIELNASIISRGGDISLDNAGINSLNTKGGSVIIHEATLYSNLSDAFIAVGTDIHVLDQLNSNGSISLDNASKMSVMNSSVVIGSGSNGYIAVYGGSTFAAKNGVVEINNSGFTDSGIINHFGRVSLENTTLSFGGDFDSAILNRGELTTYSTNITLSGSAIYGIWNGSHASITIDDSQAFLSGSLPVWAVFDQGSAQYASGSNTGMRGNMGCWDGGMFSDTDGVSSINTINNFENVANKTNWTCQ